MKKVVDTQGLFNSPKAPNSVQWSDEGLLAVSAGNAVTLLHPGRLDGPRAFVGLTSPLDTTVLDAPGAPQDPDDVHYELSNLRRAAFLSPYTLVIKDQSARSMAWSPLGCSAHGGCLLAVATPDHKVHALTAGQPQRAPLCAAKGLALVWGLTAARPAAALWHHFCWGPRMPSSHPCLQPRLLVASSRSSRPVCALRCRPQVAVYGPPSKLKSEWGPVADVSAQLLAHLAHTDWQVGLGFCVVWQCLEVHGGLVCWRGLGIQHEAPLS